MRVSSITPYRNALRWLVTASAFTATYLPLSAESPASDTRPAKDVLARLDTLEGLTRLLRAQVHYANGAKDAASAMLSCVETDNWAREAAHWQLVIWNGSSNSQSFAEMKAKAETYRSPSATSLYLHLLEDAHQGSMTFGGRTTILDLEPHWLPALRDVVVQNTAAPKSFAVDGSLYLCLLERGSSAADKILRLFASSSKLTSGGTNVAAVGALERFRRLSEPGSRYWRAEWVNERRWGEAALQYHAGDPDKAQEAFERMVEDRIARPPEYYRLARLYDANGKSEAALALVNRAIEMFPQSNSVLRVLAAEHYMKGGNSQAARSQVKACLNASPEFPPAHLLLAELDSNEGRTEAALRDCANAFLFGWGWDMKWIERVHSVLLSLDKRAVDSTR